MASVDWSWGQKYSTPVFTMMPQYPQGITNMGHYASGAPYIHQPAPTSVNQINASSPPMTDNQWQSPNVRTVKTARKRSRDELGWDEDDSSRSTTAPFPSARHTPSPPKSSSVMDSMDHNAPGQTGVWAEELSERLRTSELARDEKTARPVLDSRKSIRLDRSASSASEMASSVALPLEPRRAIVEEPARDEATLTLGISWSTIPADSTMDQASRGWARYIETHFPLQSVRIIWKSSLPAFLVGAVTCDGTPRGGRRTGVSAFFLFDDKLSQGKMIAKSWERSLDNLRAQPMVFDGDVVMDANEDEAQSHSEGNNFQHWAGWRARSVTAPPVVSAAVSSAAPVAAVGGMELD